LSDISLRDVIREDLRAALNTMLGYEGVHRIFLPQFVIQ
jgi:flagellar basal body-associated protein FliL